MELASLLVKIGADMSGLTAGLKRAAEEVKAVGESLTQIGEGMSKAVTLPLSLVGGMAIKTAADFEQLEVAFGTMLGSAEDGLTMMRQLTDFAAGTPFQMQGIAQSAKMLLGFGTTAEQIIPTLSMLGDLSAGSGKELSEIARIFGQVQSAGIMTNEAINQFNEGGIPVLAILAEQLGITKREVVDMASQGKISFEDMQGAIRQLTSEGGVFAGMMDKQSQTVAGLFSTLRDNVTNALATIGNEIIATFDLKQVTKDVTAAINTIVKVFQGFSEETRKKIVIISALVAAIGPALLMFGAIAKGVAGVIGVVKTLTTVIMGLNVKMVLIVGTLAAVAVGINYLYQNAGQLAERFEWAFAKAKNAVMSMTATALEGLSSLVGAFDRVGSIALSGMAASMRKGIKEVDKDFTEFKSVGQTVSDTFQTITGKIKDYMAGLIPAADEAGGALDGLADKTKKAGQEADKPYFRVWAEAAKMPVIELGDAVAQVGNQLQLVNEGPLSDAPLKVNELAIAAAQVLPTFEEFAAGIANAFSQAIVFGAKLQDTLRNIAKQLASQAISRFLMLALTGGTSSLFGGGVGGLLKGLFSVNDAMITSRGDIVRFNPNDNILAMKDFGAIGRAFEGQGLGTQAVHVTGQLVARGSDLVALIDNSRRVYR